MQPGLLVKVLALEADDLAMLCTAQGLGLDVQVVAPGLIASPDCPKWLKVCKL